MPDCQATFCFEASGFPSAKPGGLNPWRRHPFVGRVQWLGDNPAWPGEARRQDGGHGPFRGNGSCVGIRKNELHAIARRIIEEQLDLLRMGHGSHLVGHAMMRKRSLVGGAPDALEGDVIKRREHAQSLPLGAVSFGQV